MMILKALLMITAIIAILLLSVAVIILTLDIASDSLLPSIREWRNERGGKEKW